MQSREGPQYRGKHCRSPRSPQQPSLHALHVPAGGGLWAKDSRPGLCDDGSVKKFWPTGPGRPRGVRLRYLIPLRTNEPAGTKKASKASGASFSCVVQTSPSQRAWGPWCMAHCPSGGCAGYQGAHGRGVRFPWSCGPQWPHTSLNFRGGLESHAEVVDLGSIQAIIQLSRIDSDHF